MKTLETQVLIVGGGIVGLSASLFLANQGIQSILVERHAGTSIHPRARGLNARAMELYAELGLVEAVQIAGSDIAASVGLHLGESLAEVMQREQQKPEKQKMPFSIPLLKSSQVNTRVTQDTLEPILLQAAREHGVDARFSTECTELLQDEQGVSATLHDRLTGEDYTVRSAYVIAADGANSPIRERLGIPTVGNIHKGHLLNILFQADLTEVVKGREFSLLFIERPGISGLITSINNKERWVFHLCYNPEQGEQAADFPKERCEQILQEVIGIPGLTITTQSVLPWESRMRVAETYQQGHIFLAGDAAHQMPPWGGQGANTGIADAHNLSWKLAAVLRGEASERLLTTYTPERMPVGLVAAQESIDAASDNGLPYLKTMGPGKPDENLMKRFPRLLGFGYVYHSDALILEQPATREAMEEQLNAAVGTRAPHLKVIENGQECSTLDLFGKHFVILTSPQGGSDWKTATERTSAALGIEVNVYEVSTDDFLEETGLQETGALLVRPDGFVAYRSPSLPEHPTQKLTHAIATILARPL